MLSRVGARQHDFPGRIGSIAESASHHPRTVSVLGPLGGVRLPLPPVRLRVNCVGIWSMVVPPLVVLCPVLDVRRVDVRLGHVCFWKHCAVFLTCWEVGSPGALIAREASNWSCVF